MIQGRLRALRIRSQPFDAPRSSRASRRSEISRFPFAPDFSRGAREIAVMLASLLVASLRISCAFDEGEREGASGYSLLSVRRN